MRASSIQYLAELLLSLLDANHLRSVTRDGIRQTLHLLLIGLTVLVLEITFASHSYTFIE